VLGLRDDVHRDEAFSQHVGQPPFVEEQRLDGDVRVHGHPFREQSHYSLRTSPAIAGRDVHDLHHNDPVTQGREEPPVALPTSHTGPLPAPNPWTRLARKAREVGVLYTLMLGTRVLIPAAIFRVARMTILEILPHALTAPVVADERIRWATPQDVQQLAAFGHALDALQRRIAEGARACILTERTMLLAYVWFHGPYHDEEDLGVRFSLGPGEIWLFDAMVKVDQRGRGLYPQLLKTATRDLGREGVRRILIAIETANGNSLHAHQAAGAKAVTTVCGLRIFGFTFVWHGRRVRAAWTGSTGYVRLPTSSIA